MKRKKIILMMTFIISFILMEFPFLNPISTNGQAKGKMSLSRQTPRDPFALPSGIRSLSKVEPVIEGKEKVLLPEPPPLMVKAILISDKIRLASIDRHIVAVGDKILEEKVLEIEPDRVVLGKGDKKRILYLTQSPIRLTVEER